MTPPRANTQCPRAHETSTYALSATPGEEAAALDAHVATCSECRSRLESLRAIIPAFAFWPADVLRPSATLRKRLALRIASETAPSSMSASPRQWAEPAWQQAAPGISCKLLATDADNDQVSMLVRLDPGVAYPPHTHAGREELFLLDGELWIEDRKLYPGDYNRGERGSSDRWVWTETGCTCVLVTSTRDEIGEAEVV